MLVLAACGSSKHAPPPAAPPAEAAVATVPSDAAVDALPCPGTSEDCAACGSGDGSACFSVALAAASDGDKHTWYERGCDLGHLESCRGVSWFYTFNGSHEDFVRATARVNELEAAQLAQARTQCDAHDEKACTNAGIWIAVGTGTAKNIAAGVAVLDASCRRGNLEACAAVSVVAEDPAVQIRYDERACRGGRVISCGELLGLYGELKVSSATKAFARGELGRMCKARSQPACDTLEEFRRGPQTVPGIDDAKLDLGPLIDGAKSGKPHRP